MYYNGYSTYEETVLREVSCGDFADPLKHCAVIVITKKKV